MGGYDDSARPSFGGFIFSILSDWVGQGGNRSLEKNHSALVRPNFRQRLHLRWNGTDLENLKKTWSARCVCSHDILSRAKSVRSAFGKSIIGVFYLGMLDLACGLLG